MAGLADFKREIADGWKLNAFLASRLPIAYISGVRLRKLTERECAVSVPFKWLTQNPFRSVYFASQAMAAEMSTGVAAMAHVHRINPPVSMLVTGMRSEFHKKATGRILFTCEDVQKLGDTVAAAIATGEGQKVTVRSIGRNTQGETVSIFDVEWSFKQKQ